MSTQYLLVFRCGSYPPVTHFSGGDREQSDLEILCQRLVKVMGQPNSWK